MYSVVLMAALTAGTSAPDCHKRGCHTSCAPACAPVVVTCGCCGSPYAAMPAPPATKPAEKVAMPKTDEKEPKKEEMKKEDLKEDKKEEKKDDVKEEKKEDKKEEKKEDEKKDDKKPEVLAPNVGRLIVELPADAQLFIDGQLMKTVSERRTFHTPAIVPGVKYYYDLQAVVVIDGKPQTESRRVIVEGGVSVETSFPKLLAAVQAPRPVAGR
jgi:uncharacterized protein (TIGR03000 family)